MYYWSGYDRWVTKCHVLRQRVIEGRGKCGGCQVAIGCVYPWVLRDRNMIPDSFSSGSQSPVIGICKAVIAPMSSIQDMTQPLPRYISYRPLYLLFLGVCNGPNKYGTSL